MLKRFLKVFGREKVVLVMIFLAAVVIRFINFHESTYFGFDEARDAFTSQEIYLKGDFKLIGPPANAPGLYHGPLYWYLFGPLYIFSGGNPYFLSFVLRLLNALGVFVFFPIAKKLFGKRTAYIASLLYAFSFEQSQYAMYVCHPSFVIFSWLAIFSGAAIILKDKRKFLGLPLLIAGATSALQFELISLNTVFLLVFILFLLRKQIKEISFHSLSLSILLGLMFTSSYIVSEVKYNFRSFKSAIILFKSGYNIMPEGETKLALVLRRFVLVFKDNFFPLNGLSLYLLTFIVLFFLFFYLIRKRRKEIVLLLIWVFGGLPFLILGGYNAYYLNAGIGLGVIVGIALLLDKVIGRTILGFLLLVFVLIVNFLRIYRQSSNSLIVDIKPQPYMKLADELKLIDRMYELSNKKGFTIRVTGIPYRVQTVWAYLFNYYGRKRYGYYPYLETGMVEGFPGKLPVPIKGSTCDRFLVREPERGIPKELIQKDIDEENLFSTVVSVEKFGHFTLQYRKSNSKDCHNITEERI